MKKLTLSIAILAIAMMFAGCDNDSTTALDTTATDDYENMNMNLEFGGLTASDEDADFGVAYFEAIELEDEEEDTGDPLQEDTEVLYYEDQAREDPGDPEDPTRPRFTFLRVTFGQLERMEDGDIEDYTPLDWSGMLSVDRGIVVVRRLIRFERPGDHLVLPRPDRQTIEWVSHTGPHFDGLLVEIIEPPLDPTLGPLEPNVLHFETASYSTELILEDIAGMNETFVLENELGSINFMGFRLGDLELCPKGFLSGLWRASEEEDGGVFMGRWHGLFGRLQGLVRGRYGINDEGERVFHGKYISRTGQFRGFVRGQWEPGEDGGRGHFQGRFFDRDRQPEGVLGGGYAHAPNRPGGFFAGRWAVFCDDNAAGSIEQIVNKRVTEITTLFRQGCYFLFNY